VKVISIGSLYQTARDVFCPRGGFRSLRVLLACDGMGFSLHKTIVPIGPPQHWHYRHHREACYCIQGRGVLTNLTTRKEYTIVPDTVYVLDEFDDHTFCASEEVTLISIFTPPLTGAETHGSDGSYLAGRVYYAPTK
jgi:L-ectoine synthase